MTTWIQVFLLIFTASACKLRPDANALMEEQNPDALFRLRLFPYRDAAGTALVSAKKSMIYELRLCHQEPDAPLDYAEPNSCWNPFLDIEQEPVRFREASKRDKARTDELIILKTATTEDSLALVLLSSDEMMKPAKNIKNDISQDLVTYAELRGRKETDRIAIDLAINRPADPTVTSPPVTSFLKAMAKRMELTAAVDIPALIPEIRNEGPFVGCCWCKKIFYSGEPTASTLPVILKTENFFQSLRAPESGGNICHQREQGKLEDPIQEEVNGHPTVFIYRDCKRTFVKGLVCDLNPGQAHAVWEPQQQKLTKIDFDH